MPNWSSKAIVLSLAVSIPMLLNGCSGQTKDKKAMSAIRKVALISFTGKSAQYGAGNYHEPFLKKTYDEFKKVWDQQQEIELLAPEKVVADPTYRALQNLTLPDGVISPIKGLTYIKTGVPESASETLCRSLGVDALLAVNIDYDLKITQHGSDVSFDIKRYAIVGVPPDGHPVWGDIKIPRTFSKPLLVMLHDKALALKIGAKWVVFAGLSEDEWKQLMQIAYNSTPLANEAGAELANSFLNDAKAARSSQ